MSANCQDAHLAPWLTFCWQRCSIDHPCHLEPRCLCPRSVRCSQDHLLCSQQWIQRFHLNTKRQNIWRLSDLFPIPVECSSGTASHLVGSPDGSDGKESTCNVGDLGLIPRLGRPPGGGHDNPLQYSCLENPHGLRSLMGYSPWGHKESDMTERLSVIQHHLMVAMMCQFKLGIALKIPLWNVELLSNCMS